MDKEKVEFRGGMIGLVTPFLVVFAGIVWLAFAGAPLPKAFWVPTLAGILVALILAKDIEKVAEVMIEGMSSHMVSIMLMAWFLAGIISELLKVSGLIDGLVWAGLAVGLKGYLFPVISFIIGCLVSTATGTSIGSIIALGPTLYPVGVALGANPLAMIGAIVSGAYFGDNIAPVSDTTIASAYTQGTDVSKVVKTRLKYAFVAAGIAVVFFIIFGGGSPEAAELKTIEGLSAVPLVMLFVPAILIYLMFKGRHLIVSLAMSAVIGFIIALLFGLIKFSQILWVDTTTFASGGIIIDGINGLIGIAVFAFLLMGLVSLLEHGGFFNWAVAKTKKYANSPTSAELVVAGVTIVMNILSIASTIVIIIAGPFTRRVLHEHKITPWRSGNILDAISAAVMCLVPYAIGPLLAYTFASGSEYGVNFSLMATIPYMFHGWALLLVMLIAILTGWGRDYMDEGEFQLEAEQLKLNQITEEG